MPNPKRFLDFDCHVLADPSGKPDGIIWIPFTDEDGSGVQFLSNLLKERYGMTLHITMEIVEGDEDGSLGT